MEYNFDPIKEQIRKSINEHNRIQTVDAILYNGAVFLAITATSSAAMFANEIGKAKILSGIGALLVALERALNWGGRWRYERQMRNNYMIIQAKINFSKNLPPIFSDEEKKKIFQEVYADLFDFENEKVINLGQEVNHKLKSQLADNKRHRCMDVMDLIRKNEIPDRC